MFTTEQRLYALGLVEEGYRQKEVARIMRCHVATIRRLATYWAETGSVWADPALHNTHWDAAARDPDLTRAVLSLVEDEPVAFLKEHVLLLKTLKRANPNLDFMSTSASTVYRILRLHNYTRKKVERLFTERVEEAQVAFAADLAEIPLLCIVH